MYVYYRCWKSSVGVLLVHLFQVECHVLCKQFGFLFSGLGSPFQILIMDCPISSEQSNIFVPNLVCWCIAGNCGTFEVSWCTTSTVRSLGVSLLMKIFVDLVSSELPNLLQLILAYRYITARQIVTQNV